MVSTDQISGPVNIQKVQDDIIKLWNIVKSQPEISEEQKHHIKALYDGVLHSLHKSPDSCLHWCPWKPSFIVSVLYAGIPLPPSGQGATTHMHNGVAIAGVAPKTHRQPLPPLPFHHLPPLLLPPLPF